MSHLPAWIQKLNPFTPFKHVEIAPGYQELGPLVQGLEAVFDTQGEIIYKARNQIRIISSPRGKIVAKKFGKIYLFNRFAYAWIRKSKARRSYLNGRELLRRNIATPTPIAYTEEFKLGILYGSMYLYAYYAGDDNMRRVLKEPDYPDREALLRSFARYGCSLVEKGVFHKDFSPGNILFEKNSTGYHFTLIDINRIVFGPLSAEKKVQVFRRLFTDEDTLRILADEYARITGEDPKAVTDTMIGYSRRFIERKTRKKKFKKRLRLG